MPGGNIFAVYLAAVLAVVVIVTALGAAIVVYQRRFLAMQRHYTRQLIAAHEEERAYVAREVHDDALQRVAIIQHDLSEWLEARPGLAGSERATAQGFRDELEDLGTMLRRVAHRLHPAIIDQGGLLPALEQLADDTTRVTPVDVSTRFAAPIPDRLLERDRALILYRIAQEAMRNIAKHAGATSAEIAVELTTADLTLSVRDNGKGFDTGSSKATGLGMISMGERARLADGQLNVRSTPGSGTTILVTIPLRSPET